MDELARALEATLFASAEPLTIEELVAHVGEGEIEIALDALRRREEIPQCLFARGIRRAV